MRPIATGIAAITLVVLVASVPALCAGDSTVSPTVLTKRGVSGQLYVWQSGSC